MTQKDEELQREKMFCEQQMFSDKVRDPCHLTGKYRSPAPNKCNINVTQIPCNLIPIVFLSFIIYDCHLFFKIQLMKE